MIVRELSIFLLTIQFLTRLPLPRELGYSPERFAATPRYFAPVGLLLGALAAACLLIAAPIYGPLVAAVAACIATLAATGAFHEDGLADLFDGVGGGATRERALEIMRDSRIGVYGASALFMALALKIALLAGQAPFVAAAGLIGAHGLSRASIVIMIATSRYARDAGAAKPVAEGVSTASLALTCGVALAIILGLSLATEPIAGLYALIGAAGGHVIARAIFERKLGGYTGDGLGGVQQFTELGVYLGLFACV